MNVCLFSKLESGEPWEYWRSTVKCKSGNTLEAGRPVCSGRILLEADRCCWLWRVSQGEVQLSFLPSLGISVLLMSFSFLFILYHKIYSIGRWWEYVIEEKKFCLEGVSTHLRPRKIHVFKYAKEMPNEMHSTCVVKKQWWRSGRVVKADCLVPVLLTSFVTLGELILISVYLGEQCCKD